MFSKKEKRVVVFFINKAIEPTFLIKSFQSACKSHDVKLRSHRFYALSFSPDLSLEGKRALS